MESDLRRVRGKRTGVPGRKRPSSSERIRCDLRLWKRGRRFRRRRRHRDPLAGLRNSIPSASAERIHTRLAPEREPPNFAAVSSKTAKAARMRLDLGASDYGNPAPAQAAPADRSRRRRRRRRRCCGGGGGGAVTPGTPCSSAWRTCRACSGSPPAARRTRTTTMIRAPDAQHPALPRPQNNQ